MEPDKWSPDDYDDYNYKGAIICRWSKDGAWHIALPCPDPDENGRATGGLRWEPYDYRTKTDAIKAVDEAIK